MMLGFQMLFWPQPKVGHVHVHNNLIFCPHTEIVWFVYGTASHLYFIVSVIIPDVIIRLCDFRALQLILYV